MTFESEECYGNLTILQRASTVFINEAPRLRIKVDSLTLEVSARSLWEQVA